MTKSICNHLLSSRQCTASRHGGVAVAAFCLHGTLRLRSVFLTARLAADRDMVTLVPQESGVKILHTAEHDYIFHSVTGEIQKLNDGRWQVRFDDDGAGFVEPMLTDDGDHSDEESDWIVLQRQLFSSDGKLFISCSENAQETSWLLDLQQRGVREKCWGVDLCDRKLRMLVYISDYPIEGTRVRWALPNMLRFLFGSHYDSRWFANRKLLFQRHLEKFGLPSHLCPSSESVRRHCSKAGSAFPTPEVMVVTTSEFSITTAGLLALIMGIQQSKMREEFGDVLPARLEMLFRGLLQSFLPAVKPIRAVLNHGDDFVVCNIRDRRVWCVKAPGQACNFSNGRCVLSRPMLVEDALRYLTTQIYRPSQTKYAQLALTLFNFISGLVTSQVEIEWDAEVFERFNLLALGRQESSKSSSARVPLGLKRTAAQSVAAAEGISKTNQFMVSQKILDGTQPSKRIRNCGKATNAKSCNTWCVDNSIQYMLHSQVEFKVLPEVSQ